MVRSTDGILVGDDITTRRPWILELGVHHALEISVACRHIRHLGFSLGDISVFSVLSEELDPMP